MGWRDWLTRLSRKASPVTRLIVELVGAGRPVYTPRDFYNLARQGYERNVYVYRAVNAISVACAGIPWLLYERQMSDGRLVELDEHPLLSLMRRPNPEQAQARFVREVVSYWLLAGNSYIYGIRPESQKAPPQELWVLRPDRMTVIPDELQRVRAYRYSTGRSSVTLPREDVLHLKLFAPVDDWYGLSPVVVAARVVDQNNAMTDWNTALLQNGARPSLALIAQEELSEEVFQRLKKELQSEWGGPRNAGLPKLLEGGLDVKILSFSPQELDWLKGDMHQGRKIALALGYPPELMGDPEQKTYANYREARKAFYMDTVIPLMDELRDELNAWLAPQFGDRLYLDYDRDEIEALSEDRARVAERLEKSWWLSINERRLAQGYEPVEGGDVICVPANLVPLEVFTNGEPFGPEPGPEEEEEPSA